MEPDMAYRMMFQDYPDVLNINELAKLLNVSKKTAYSLVQANKITSLKVGREYRIPKIYVINYLLDNNSETYG